MKNGVKIFTLGMVILSNSALYAQYNSQNLKLFKNKISQADTIFRPLENGVSMSSAQFASYNWEFGNTTALQQQLSAEEQKFSFGNLRIYMIASEPEFRKAHRDIGHYLGLQEALSKNVVKVTESSGGVVNTLIFENVGKDTVMILAGEVVTGGKQDRVVAKDMLLVPNSGPVQVAVFCVERGRWSQNGSGYQFQGHHGFTTSDVRKAAVIDKNQGEVWSKVAEKNKAAGTSPSTGTFAAIAGSEQVMKDLPGYVKHFDELILADTNYIGFVAVTGDSIIACDLFANHALYKQQAKNLLKAAAVEAITTGAAVTISTAKVLGFLDGILRDETKQETEVQENGTMLKKGSQKLHINYFKR